MQTDVLVTNKKKSSVWDETKGGMGVAGGRKSEVGNSVIFSVKK